MNYLGFGGAVLKQAHERASILVIIHLKEFNSKIKKQKQNTSQPHHVKRCTHELTINKEHFNETKVDQSYHTE